MMLRSVEQADVANKRVLVRVDFNVPLDDGRITDDTRIRAALPTIRYLIDHHAKVILVSHLGRPKGKPVEGLRLRPIADRLSELLGQQVATVPAVVGADAGQAVARLEPGHVLLLENVRFEPGEEKNDSDLAHQLASLADIYVNDAFGAAHRAHASTVGVAHELPSYAGFLMQGEIDALGQVLKNPEAPFIAILGGAKVSDKLGVIENLLDKVDALLIGGGMANTLLLAQAINVGNSLAETDLVGQAREILAKAQTAGVTIELPVDAIVAADLDKPGTPTEIDKIPADGSIFDIGPETARRFSARIAGARTIFWNGPMGVFERPQFAAGTKAVAQAVAESPAFSVVGGGDSVAAVEQMGVADRISHISTGGGASLEFVEGRTLPGVAALEGNPTEGTE